MARGTRFRLSIYGQVLRRQRMTVFLLACLLIGLGILTWFRWIAWPAPPLDRWLLGAGLLAALYWLYSLVAPALAFVEPRRGSLLVQIPFYRLNISYRRIRSTRPIDVARAFPPETTPRRHRRTLRKFYGNTAIGIDFISWPLPRWLLAMMLGRMMLAPDQPGMILITPRWMELSTLLETRMGEVIRSRRGQGEVGQILNWEQDDE